MNPGATHQANGGAERSPAPPSVHRTDLGLALVLLGVCAFLWWDTTRFAEVPDSLAQNAPPTAFPRLLLGVIALMSLMLPFEHRFKNDGGEGIDKARVERPRPIVFITGAVLVAILALTPWLGTFLAMVAAAVVIPLLWGERRYGILAAFAIGLPLIVLFVFAVLLDVNLVPGIAGDLFG